MRVSSFSRPVGNFLPPCGLMFTRPAGNCPVWVLFLPSCGEFSPRHAGRCLPPCGQLFHHMAYFLPPSGSSSSRPAGCCPPPCGQLSLHVGYFLQPWGATFSPPCGSLSPAMWAPFSHHVGDFLPVVRVAVSHPAAVWAFSHHVGDFLTAMRVTVFRHAGNFLTSSWSSFSHHMGRHFPAMRYLSHAMQLLFHVGPFLPPCGQLVVLTPAIITTTVFLLPSCGW